MYPEKHAVLIVCERQLVRLGLALMVHQRPDLEVIGTANDYKEAVPLLRNCAPKVIILSVGTDPTELPSLIFRMKAASPQARLLVMADIKDALLIRRFLKAGASGYLLVSAPAEDLLEAVHQLVAGGSFIDPKLLVGLASVSHPWQAVEMEARRQLSSREEEVLRFVVRGRKRREIAHQLSISSKTVDTHCARAMKKLGLRRREDAVEYGLSQGWLIEGAKRENSLAAG